MKGKNVLLIIGAIFLILVISDSNLFFSTLDIGGHDIKMEKTCYERENGYCSLWTPRLESGEFFIDVSAPLFKCEQSFPSLLEEGGASTCIGSRCPEGGEITIQSIQPTQITLADGTKKTISTQIVNTYPGKNLAEWSTSLNPDCWYIDVMTSEGNMEGLWIGDTFTTDCFSVIILDDTFASYKGGNPTSARTSYGVDIIDTCFDTKIAERPQFLLFGQSKTIPISLQNTFSEGKLDGGVEYRQKSITFPRATPGIVLNLELPSEINIAFNTSELGDFDVRAKQFLKFTIDYPESTEEQTFPSDSIIFWSEKEWITSNYKVLREEQFNPSDSFIPFDYPEFKDNEKIEITLYEKITNWLREVFKWQS